MDTRTDISPRRSTLSYLSGDGVQALLVGSGNYTTSLEPLPSVHQTVEDLANALSERCGLQLSSVNVVHNPERVEDVCSVLADMAKRATELLLFYYVGHGLVASNGSLYLATERTDPRWPQIVDLRLMLDTSSSVDL